MIFIIHIPHLTITKWSKELQIVILGSDKLIRLSSAHSVVVIIIIIVWVFLSRIIIVWVKYK